MNTSYLLFINNIKNMKLAIKRWFNRLIPSLKSSIRYNFIYLTMSLKEDLLKSYVLNNMNKTAKKTGQYGVGQQKWYKLYASNKISVLNIIKTHFKS